MDGRTLERWSVGPGAPQAVAAKRHTQTIHTIRFKATSKRSLSLPIFAGHRSECVDLR
jgi:hypothetical protein